MSLVKVQLPIITKFHSNTNSFTEKLKISAEYYKQREVIIESLNNNISYDIHICIF